MKTGRVTRAHRRRAGRSAEEQMLATIVVACVVFGIITVVGLLRGDHKSTSTAGPQLRVVAT